MHTGLIEMRGTTAPRLLLELICARMLLPGARRPTGALLQRLERMERRLSAAGDPVEAPPADRQQRPAGAGSRRRAEAPRAPAAGRRPARPPAGSDRGAPAEIAEPGQSRDRPTGRRAPADRSRPPPNRDRLSRDRPSRDRRSRDPRRPGRIGPSLPTETAPVPGERVHTPVGHLDAAAVRRIWPEVLDNVKRRRRTAHALLMNVSVQSVDNDVLTLTISSIPLSRLLAQDANTDVVRSAVKDVLGVDWRINVVVDGGAVRPRRSPPARRRPRRDDDPRDGEPSPPTADSGPVRADPEEAAISLLQSTLGAKRMDG